MTSLEIVREKFQHLVDPRLVPSWISELAGILPLSALIDFTDIPKTLHMYQLTGRMPLWCWPVTPAAGRILLRMDPAAPGCCLDQANAGSSPTCLDGRYGNQYPMANAETVRMCVEATPVNTDYLPDSDKNTSATNKVNVEAEKGKRLQYLELVVVKSSKHVHNEDKLADEEQALPDSGKYRRNNRRSLKNRSNGTSASWRYNLASNTGWILWSGLIVACGILHLWLALAFLITTVSVGATVSSIHGKQSRRPGARSTEGYGVMPTPPVKKHALNGKVPKPSSATKARFNRVVVTAQDVNATYWRVFHGQSEVISSLLNWPMASQGRKSSKLRYFLLRVLMLGQWSMAIGSAALKGWDAYFIAFWIILCIFSINYLFATSWDIEQWLCNAGVSLTRYQAVLSSRRSVLGTIMVLNHDTFPATPTIDAHGLKVFDEEGVVWLDPILPGATDWREAMRCALSVPLQSPQSLGLVSSHEDKWFWKYVKESVEMGNLIQSGAGVSDRVFN